MSFGNMPLAFEDHGTTALKAEVAKLHSRHKHEMGVHSTRQGMVTAIRLKAQVLWHALTLLRWPCALNAQTFLVKF